MKPEHYKPIRKEKPKRKGKTSKSKKSNVCSGSRMETHYFPQLREAYSTKTEWARNLIPKLKKEAESRKKKKSSDKHTHKF